MNKKDIFILLIVIIASVLILLFIPKYDYIKNDIYINEIMAGNYNTIKDNYDNYSDYIEIYNSTNKDVNLKGYHLSDSEFDINKWTFPDIEIKAKSYLIVYASGLNTYKDNIVHTNFKLSSKGETLVLTDNTGNIISKFTYPSLDKDISYGYKNKKYMMFETPTPGKENDSKELKISNKKYKLVINEYMTHNKKSVYDNHGLYNDFVEIYNDSNEDITLENIYITDNKYNLEKYKIPKVNIKKNGYLVIYFTKEKVNYNDNIYVPFSINTDEYIIISDGKKIIDEVKVIELPTDISYGLVDEEFKYFTNPTPGKENDTLSFDNIGGTNGSN